MLVLLKFLLTKYKFNLMFSSFYFLNESIIDLKIFCKKNLIKYNSFRISFIKKFLNKSKLLGIKGNKIFIFSLMSFNNNIVEFLKLKKFMLYGIFYQGQLISVSFLILFKDFFNILYFLFVMVFFNFLILKNLYFNLKSLVIKL